MARESRWFWGYLHADPYSVLFFDPEDYPGARGLMLLAEGNECPIVVENRGLQVTPPRAGTGEVVVRYHDEDTALSLSIDSAVPRSGGFPIFIAPYRLELERSGDRHIAAGSMVFEIGQWSTF